MAENTVIEKIKEVFKHLRYKYNLNDAEAEKLADALSDENPLPIVSAEDNGKVLTVANGEWTKGEIGDAPLHVNFDGDFISETASIPVSEINAILENLPASIDFIYNNGNTHNLMTRIKSVYLLGRNDEIMQVDARYVFGYINNETLAFEPEMSILIATEGEELDTLSVIKIDGESRTVYIFDSIDGNNVILNLVGGGGDNPPIG